jgi:hypothetical protein
LTDHPLVEPEEATSSATRETVETVFEYSRLKVTGLKPGVNEMGPLSDFSSKAAR